MVRHLNIVLCTGVAALVALGLVMLASTSAWVDSSGESYHFFWRQLWMAIAGVIGAIVLAQVDPIILRRWWPYMLAGACFLLILCYVPGVAVDKYGERRWIQVPVIGRFQPSEIAKAVTMIAMAGWFARWQTEIRSFWRGFIIPGIILAIPFLLILFETDMGTAVGIGAAGFAVLFAAGTRLIYLLPTIGAGTAAFAYLVQSNENRWSRIEAWLQLLNGTADPNGKAFQQIHALFAFGSGGVEGKGLGNGVEKTLIPFAESDFIFPTVGEELGLWGTLAAVFCYVMIAVAGVGIAATATNVFNRCLAVGLTTVIVVPAMINIGVVTGSIPNSGLPLPFVSHGGTNLIFTLGAVGLLCGIYRRTCQEGRPKKAPVQASKTYEVRL